MDNNALNVLWQTALGEIETEVSQANFFTLFKKTQLVSINKETAEIGSPSNISIDLLQKRFYKIIKNTLDKHTGKNLKIIFVPKTIKPEKKAAEGPLFSSIINKTEEKKVVSKLARVRSDYVFETLAVSSSNQLAFVSAQTVAKNPGTSYNPLFIYGPTGVGKTHLMQAIANLVFQKDPVKKVVYLTSEEFTNEVVEAIKERDTGKMKKRFRTADLLIIDDVQFIAGKDRVQEELFHTFNILIDKSSQIVLTSDRPPLEIKKLEKRLSSRFSAGLTVDIEPPDFELRTAILLIKAKKFGIDLPMEAAKIIAEKIQDVRSLEGTLLRVMTESQAKNSKIDVFLVNSVLNGKTKAQSMVHPDEIIKIVCSFYDIKITLLKGPRRNATLVKARHVAMFLLKREFGIPFVEIGHLLGGRDHTTIMHGVEKVENMLLSRVNFSTEVMGIRELLSQQKMI